MTSHKRLHQYTGGSTASARATPEGLAQRLAWALGRTTLRQADVGAAVGVGQATVSEWARGISLPSAERLVLLPEVLEVSGHWLLTGRGPIEPPGMEADEGLALAAARRQVAEEFVRLVRQAAAGYGDVGATQPDRSPTPAEAESLLEEAERVAPAPDAAAPRRGQRKSG